MNAVIERTESLQRDPVIATHPDAGLTAKSVRVVIVEDQTAIRHLLATHVESLPGFSVVGHCDTSTQAVDLVLRLRPHVIVLDWVLSDGPAEELLKTFAEMPHAPAVLVFSANLSPQAVGAGLRQRVCGIVEKTAGFGDFVDALKAVASGNSYFGPGVSETMRKLVNNRRKRATTKLSPRESQILREVADGHSSREIAARLQLSVRTVDNHRAAIASKAGVTSVAMLTRYALQLGLISPDPVLPDSSL